jgi:hypothetical protein
MFFEIAIDDACARGRKRSKVLSFVVVVGHKK